MVPKLFVFSFFFFFFFFFHFQGLPCELENARVLYMFFRKYRGTLIGACALIRTNTVFGIHRKKNSFYYICISAHCLNSILEFYTNSTH